MTLLETLKKLYAVYQEEEDRPADKNLLVYLISSWDYRALLNEMYSEKVEPFGTDGNAYVDGIIVVHASAVERGEPMLCQIKTQTPK